MSYKILLLKALPNEMKFLNSYALKIGAKLLVDNPGYVGFVKEQSVNGVIQQHDLRYPAEQDAAPPDGVSVVPGYVQVLTDNNLDSKKSGIGALYLWSQQLDQSGYNQTVFLSLPEGAPPEEQSLGAMIIKG